MEESTSNPPQRVALLLSGGPDSATLLYEFIDTGVAVEALTFDFGEREAEQEHRAAARVAGSLEGVNHYHFDFANSLRDSYGLPWPALMRRSAIPFPMQGLELPDSRNVPPFGSLITLSLAACGS